MSVQAEATATAGSKLKSKVSRKTIPYIVVFLIAAIATSVMLVRDEGNKAKPPSASYESTARVEVRDLVETATYDGTLGYSDSRSLLARGQGTLTDIAAEGSTVKRGESLYEVDGSDVILLYGSTPMYRDLSDDVSDGQDIKELERNLVAMDYDPDGDIEIDQEWDWATTEAVERWEDDRGVTEDGTVSVSEVVFLPGARVVGEHLTDKGAPVHPGAAVMATSARQRIVTLDVEVGEAADFSRGERVSVELPNGKEVRARISSVGRVATADETDESADPTIEVTVTLNRKASTGGFDQASVDVIVETARVKDALSVPVTALLATTNGFAVEVIEKGRTRQVPVTVGDYADGWVEVIGNGLTEGTKVVTAS